MPSPSHRSERTSLLGRGSAARGGAAPTLRSQMVSGYLLFQWIVLSFAIIIFNKWLIDPANKERGFSYPATLVLFHMTFMSVCSFVWRRLGWISVPVMPCGDVVKLFMPIAVCYSLALYGSNDAYEYISVAFIQMLKASTVVLVLVCSFALRLETPTRRLVACILLISSGLVVACFNQVSINMRGVAVQMLSVVAEALRLCYIAIAFGSRTHAQRLTPLAMVYFVGPLTILALVVPWLVTEAPDVFANGLEAVRRTGAPLLLANASLAFALNIASMAAIKHTSALTMNVAGVVKDVLLILWSVYVSGAVVTNLQTFGYMVAVVGVVWYGRIKHEAAAARAAAEKRAVEEAERENDELDIGLDDEEE